MPEFREIVEEHLSRLENVQTRWSLLRHAGKGGGSATELRNALVLRYVVPIRAYIAAIVQDEVAADEIAQDAVVRLLQGDFAGADPERGRFRDLLKTALRNMVRNHWKKARVRKSSALDFDVSEDDSGADDPWVLQWRQHLLNIAWADLRQIEESDASRCPCSVLKVRVERPDADSTELAEALGQVLGREIKAAAYRQQLKRARQRFAETLLGELRDGLDDPSPERIHDEVIALGLYPWLKDKLADPPE
jgi:DNA-directed RNA polymerase specialized sigma24 family protein